MFSYLRKGQLNHPPLIFLHGFLGSCLDWELILERLSSHFHCIAFDFLNPLFNARNLLADTLDRLEESLQSFSIQKATFVGYSMGGRIAMHFAKQKPNFIDKLVILSANPGIENAEERKTKELQEKEFIDLLQTEGIDSFLEKWYSNALFEPLKRQENLFQNMLKNRKRLNEKQIAIVLKELSAAKLPSLWDNISFPTLYLFGEKDKKYKKIAEKLQAMHPHVEIEQISKAGHALHLEAPLLVADKIEKFQKENHYARTC